MLHRKDPSSTRKVSPPSQTAMSNDQFASYLAGLRDNRVARPGGARPQPASVASRRDSDRFSTRSMATTGRPSVGSTAQQPDDTTTTHSHSRNHSDSSSKKRRGRSSLTGSVTSRHSNMSSGRDYYPDGAASAPLKPSDVVPTSTYMERGQRWMEKEEVYSLRRAMDAMDVNDTKDDQCVDEPTSQQQDGEERLYNAALDEAAELVWQHQNGIKTPEPGAPYEYKPHLRQNSYAHARAASIGLRGNEIGATGLARDSVRSFSGSSSGSEPRNSSESEQAKGDQRRVSGRSANSKPYGSLSSGRRSGSGSHRRRSSLKRNISGEVQKPFSGDQIWEEPEGSTPEQASSKARPDPQPESQNNEPLASKAPNPTNRVQFAPEATAGAAPSQPSAPSVSKRLERFEIHRNPPSQSRNANYTTNNSPFNRKKTQAAANAAPDEGEVDAKDGKEVRSDDIRQATSMRLKDRSAKLPTPSAVSDSPGRPIVSFDKNWKAPEEATDSKLEESRRVPLGIGKDQPGQIPTPPNNTVVPPPTAEASPAPSRPSGTPIIPHIQVEGRGGPPAPSISVAPSAPSAIPSIVLPDGDSPSPAGIPSIVTPDDTPAHSIPGIPSIVTPDDEFTRPAPGIPTVVTPGDDKAPTNRPRPLPTPQAVARPHLRNARGQGGDGGTASPEFSTRPRSHWSPAPGVVSRSTATCHECGFPIEGRFAALRGTSERFHPQCFRCYSCGTGLEALEISPEPDKFRDERLDRIRRRAEGEALEEEPGKTMAEDGDERLRFYCHLDWHELFAPRCKHCRTPILGEHMVALGEHWHYGHFFCAECGDPFEKGMTHIEKDGYAWCVKCQTRRTERRAPKCRRCRTAVIGQYVMALGGEWHDECFRCSDCGGGFDDGQIFPIENRDGKGGAAVLCTQCRSRELKM